MKRFLLVVVLALLAASFVAEARQRRPLSFRMFGRWSIVRPGPGCLELGRR